MAASVENRQFGNLEPASILVIPVLADGKVVGTHRRTGSPMPSFGSPAPVTPVPNKEKGHRLGEDDDSDDDEEAIDWKQRYGDMNLEVEPSIDDPRDEGTADAWVVRNPSLIRLTGKHPFNSEPPLGRLMLHGFITPVPIHYVRNHGAVPKADWDTWTVEITGLVNRPVRLTMNEMS
ncbi:hypothetical protein Cni_G22523 [Canna indica]|uniref:Uncharacterized protein n=1 Tax=Canna indica TaxID=4628 RepID=A0AAQ3KSS5_9LILI|nr:hypothetical protein Cni_G22523 [Canna indica]